jgi:hypothetical protein
LTTFEQLFYGIPVGSKVDGSGSATGSFINLFL